MVNQIYWSAEKQSKYFKILLLNKTVTELYKML